MGDLPVKKSKKATEEAVPPKATEKEPVPNQTQIHAGNIPVLTVKLLDGIYTELKRIADALEKANG